MNLTLRLDGKTLWFDGQSRPFGPKDEARLSDFAKRYGDFARRDAELARLGRDLYAWLDGSGRWGERLTGTVLVVSAPPAEAVFLNAPWELLFHQGWLVDGGFEVVRWPSSPHLRVARERSKGALSLLFMAAAPEGVSRLAFEAEEAAILKATCKVRCDLWVEETGTASELGITLAQLSQEAPVDVLHLTCHGDPTPALLLETKTGASDPTTPKALAEQVALSQVGLVVASACFTATVSAGNQSLATALLDAGARAVLGWAAPVSDEQAIVFAAAFYESLAQGDPAAAALQKGRAALRERAVNGQPGSDWHLARLFTAGTERDALPVDQALATCRGPLRRVPDAGLRAFLDPQRRKVPVATREGFVGRRRLLQQALRHLLGQERVGVLLCGLGHQGKSSLAARLVSRLGSHRPVVCHGAEELSAPSILKRLAEECHQGVKGDTLEAVRTDPWRLTREVIAVLQGAQPVLLILDDVEQILDLQKTPVAFRDPAARRTFAGLLRAFDAERARGHRLILTCRVDFPIVSDDGEDLAPTHLHPLSVTGLSPVERQLLPARRQVADRALAYECLRASQGNPGLAGRLLVLAKEASEANHQAKAALLDLLSRLDQETGHADLDAWMAECIDDLRALLTEGEAALLKACQLLTVPVDRAAVEEALAAPLGVPSGLDRLCALQLLEVHGPALRLDPLVALRLPPLDDAERRALAAALIPAINRLAPPTDGAGAWHLYQLAEWVEDDLTREAQAEAALQSRLDALEMTPARHIARFVLTRLEAGALNPSLLLTLWAADALEGVEPQAAARLLSAHPQDPVVLVHQGRLLRWEGNSGEALACFEQAARQLCDHPRAYAIARGEIAGLHRARGQLDEALRLLRDEELPVYERLGDVRSVALTKGEIADILTERGQLDEALRIWRDEALPVFERLGEVRLVAVAKGQMADILTRRGQLDEALCIHRDEALPVFELLGEVRSVALTKGEMADILTRRGQLDEALRLLRDEALPVFERLGEVRSVALTKDKMADILTECGQLDEALRLLRDEVLPIYERLGEVRSLLVARKHLAYVLFLRGNPQQDAPEVLNLLSLAYAEAKRLGLPEEGQIAELAHGLGVTPEQLSAFSKLTPEQIADLLVP